LIGLLGFGFRPTLLRNKSVDGLMLTPTRFPLRDQLQLSRARQPETRPARLIDGQARDQIVRCEVVVLLGERKDGGV